MNWVYIWIAVATSITALATLVRSAYAIKEYRLRYMMWTEHINSKTDIITFENSYG